MAFFGFFILEYKKNRDLDGDLLQRNVKWNSIIAYNVLKPQFSKNLRKLNSNLRLSARGLAILIGILRSFDPK